MALTTEPRARLWKGQLRGIFPGSEARGACRPDASQLDSSSPRPRLFAPLTILDALPHSPNPF
eukprot:6208811-Pleurochrysis_carterae.AAC.3